ncbi:low molecular weight phosphatase family protein [Micrococcus terreus]|uniref:arsenate-mycothiol transferase ArsC n=1 Tax=Micrococcus terreus TaxID=574650 RepID=UPI003015C52C
MSETTDHTTGPATGAEEPRGLNTGGNPIVQNHVMERVIEELAQKWGELLDHGRIRTTALAAYQELDRTARIKTFLPTHAARLGDDRLHAYAVAEGLIEAPLPKVLFVCPSNTGRSQIAAALMGRLNSVAVRSGGITPGGHLHHRAVQALNERGIDLSEMYPKELTEDVMRAAEYVVAIDTAGDLPDTHGATVISWTDVPQLTDKPIEEVRQIVDLIEGKVRALSEDLVGLQTQPSGDATQTGKVLAA